MAIIANQQPYDPTGFNVSDLLNPDVFNAEINAIAAGFDLLNALGTPITADTALSSSVRNALVDLSGLINTGNGIKVTLPASPNIGDPPCIVAVQKSGYHSSGTVNEGCAIVTSTDQTIDSVTPDNTTYANQSALFNPGDIAVYTFVGGDVGWRSTVRRTVICNPNGAFTAPALGIFPIPRSDSFLQINATAYAMPTTIQPGDAFSIIKNGTGALTFGSTSDTFNGAAGPYSAASNYVRYRFVCLAAGQYSVTT